MAKLYFWCHVGECASLRLQHAILLSGKAKICELDRQVLHQQDVLELEVAMHDVLVVHVLQNVHYLVQEKSADVLAHWTVFLT